MGFIEIYFFWIKMEDKSLFMKNINFDLITYYLVLKYVNKLLEDKNQLEIDKVILNPYLATK